MARTQNFSSRYSSNWCDHLKTTSLDFSFFCSKTWLEPRTLTTILAWVVESPCFFPTPISGQAKRGLLESAHGLYPAFPWIFQSLVKRSWFSNKLRLSCFVSCKKEEKLCSSLGRGRQNAFILTYAFSIHFENDPQIWGRGRGNKRPTDWPISPFIDWSGLSCLTVTSLNK